MPMKKHFELTFRTLTTDNIESTSLARFEVEIKIHFFSLGGGFKRGVWRNMILKKLSIQRK
jgi:hypothetical protein